MVLLVGDDRAQRETLQEFLALEGYAVRCAANGWEALQWSKRSDVPPQLILLDMAMPVLDGWGFLRERHKDPVLAKIPVVIVRLEWNRTPGYGRRGGGRDAQARCAGCPA
jgi:CheY-like chemotaxis protein